jgi:alkanesulfonate monooxygenase SsuD/methylene tetrahydromethanopterin reductase-like flavin-dependent oxidoreductase (luciferase family)
MLRITARFADEWNTWGGPTMAGGARAKFEAACEAVDRDPASMWTSVQALVFVTDDDAQAEQILAGPMGARSIAGPPDRLVEIIGEYAELGFDEFIVPDFNLGESAAQRREGFERIDEQVVAQVN